MPLSVGDAVLDFHANTMELDQAFARIPEQADKAMSAAADSVDQLGDSLKGVSFELDATASNAAYAGGEIKDSMEKAGYSIHEAQGEAMLLGEAFGIHLPRHVSRFLAELPGIGAALSTAFAATAVLFLVEAVVKGGEKLQEWINHAHKVAIAMDEFNTAVTNSFGGLEEKLLQAGVSIDELKGDHVDALRKQLELVDRVSMKELVGEFGLLAKAADAVFAELTTSWYQFGSGSAGAKRALEDFKAQYDLLLAEGKSKEASDLLAGTLKSAKDSLTTMEATKKEAEEANKIAQSAALAGVTAMQAQAGPTEKELKAQEALVRILTQQIKAQTTIQELAKDDSIIKVSEEAKRQAEERVAAEKQALDAQLANIETWKSAQHAAYSAGEIDAAAWRVAELQATDAAAIAHEDYLTRILAVYTRSGQAIKAHAAAQELDTFKTKEAAKETDALAAAMEKHRDATRKVVAAYADLVNVGVEKDFAATAKATETLTKADDELLKAQTKLKESTLADAFRDQEEAITKLAAMHLITESQKDDRLKLLEQKQADGAIAILTDQLDKENAMMAAAQAKIRQAQTNPFFTAAQLADVKKNLSAAEEAYAGAQIAVQAAQKNLAAAEGNPLFSEAQLADLKKKLAEAEAAYHQAQETMQAARERTKDAASNPYFTPAQVLELEANLKKAETAVTNTQAEIVAAKEKYNKESEADDKSHYGRALLIAIAAGNELVAEQLRQNHALLLAAEASLKVAKARGEDTTAIEKQISALKQNESALEKEAKGHKANTAEIQKEATTLLQGLQTQLEVYKQRGLDTTAIEQEIKYVEQLQTQTTKETNNEKLYLAQKVLNTQQALLFAQNLLLEQKAHQQNTTAIEKEIKDLQNLLALMQQLPAAAQKDATALQQLASQAQQMEQQLGQAVAQMFQSVLTGQESFTKAFEKMVSQMAVQYGEFMVARGVADLFSDPGVGAGEIAAGVALMALGDLIGGTLGGSGSSSAGPYGPSVGQTTQASTGGGTGGSGGQPVSTTKLAEGGVVSQPTTFIAGDSKSGGSATEAVLPLSDPNAMRQVAQAIAPAIPPATPREESGMDPEAITRMMAAISALTGTRDASAQEFKFAEPGTGEKPGFQFADRTEPSSQPSAISSQFTTVGEALGFARETAASGEKQEFKNAAPSTVGQALGFSAATPSAGEKPEFKVASSASAEPTPASAIAATTTPAETPGFVSGGPSTPSEKQDFISPAAGPVQPRAFVSPAPTVGEALGFSNAQPEARSTQPFTAAQASASERPEFMSAEASAARATDFEKIAPANETPIARPFLSAEATVGEALGFSSSKPEARSSQPFSAPSPSASEKQDFTAAEPGAGAAPNFLPGGSPSISAAWAAMERGTSAPSIPQPFTAAQPSPSEKSEFTSAEGSAGRAPSFEKTESRTGTPIARPFTSAGTTVGQVLGFPSSAAESGEREFSAPEPRAAATPSFLLGGSPSPASDIPFASSQPAPRTPQEFTAAQASESEKAAFSSAPPSHSASEKASLHFAPQPPSAREAAGFTSGEPAPGDKPSFGFAEPSESDKAAFLAAQPSLSAKPGFETPTSTPTVGEALGFKFDTPYPGDKPAFSSGQPSAPEKPGFSLAAPSATDQRDFAASSPSTVGEALGFAFSAPRTSYEGLGFASGQPSSTSPPGFSSGVQSPHEKQTLDVAAPSAGERPGFSFTAPSIPREMPDMESLAANFGGLLSQPTLRAASNGQVLAAAAAGSPAATPMDVEARMEKFADRLAAQIQPEGASSAGEGVTNHFHINVKGLMDAGNLKKIIAKQNRMVQNRQVTVKASDSLRVTRRSQ